MNKTYMHQKRLKINYAACSFDFLNSSRISVDLKPNPLRAVFARKCQSESESRQCKLHCRALCETRELGESLKKNLNFEKSFKFFETKIQFFFLT